MSIFDDPLPCNGEYDCEECDHYEYDACTILIQRIHVQIQLKKKKRREIAETNL